MKAAKIVDAKDNLSKYLPFVRKGGRVRVMQRGKAIAELVPVVPQELAPVVPQEDPLQAYWDELERRGAIRRGSGEPFPEGFLDEPGPPAGEGGTLAALQAERRKRG